MLIQITHSHTLSQTLSHTLSHICMSDVFLGLSLCWMLLVLSLCWTDGLSRQLLLSACLHRLSVGSHFGSVGFSLHLSQQGFGPELLLNSKSAFKSCVSDSGVSLSVLLKQPVCLSRGTMTVNIHILLRFTVK